MSNDGFRVYVCYEANNHDLAIECGAVNQLTVFGNANKAIEWFFDRLKAAKDDGFIIDSESNLMKEGEINDAAILDELKEEYVSVTMFRGWEENWDESYDIVIVAEEVVS